MKFLSINQLSLIKGFDDLNMEKIKNSQGKETKGRPIFIVGYMGSGKTTVGRKLALALDYEFVDVDSYIENEEAKSIKSIFSEEGESAFRKLEKEALKKLVKRRNTVIATGGGLPCFNQNMDSINKYGISIYLLASPQELAQRLLNDEERPLLMNKGGSELTKHISNMLSKRRKYYLQAQIRIRAARNPDAIVNTALKTLRKK